MGEQRNEGRRHRRAAEEAAAARTRWRNRQLLRLAAAIVVVGVAAYAYRSYTTRHMLDAVTTASYPAARHVAGHIDYREHPPIGGPHNVIWQNCAIYDVPI